MVLLVNSRLWGGGFVLRVIGKYLSQIRSLWVWAQSNLPTVMAYIDVSDDLLKSALIYHL